MSDLTLSFLRAIASLSATLGLIVLLAWAWKRYGGTFTPMVKSQPRLNVLEAKRLNQHTTLYVVRDGTETDGTEYLLASTSAQTNVISSRSLTKSAKVKS